MEHAPHDRIAANPRQKEVRGEDPAVRSLDRRRADAVPPATSDIDRPGERHPLHILVAEDNAVNQKVALRILERLGYRADVAANGLEVLSALRRQPYDVILMDMQMPEMDGLEATRRIRRDWPWEHVPRIVAMTANAMREDREQCLGAGMDDYVAKPVQVHDLQAALERCIAASGKRTLVPTAPPPDRPADEPVLDPETVEGLRELARESRDTLLQDLVVTFAEDAPKRLSAIRDAIVQHDAAALGRSAHGLKGGCAALGARHMADLCAGLEDMAKEGSLDQGGPALTALEVESERVGAALRRLAAGEEAVG